MNYTIVSYGIASMAIPFVVQYLKKWIPVRFAPVAAFLIGAIFGLVSAYLKKADLLTGILEGIGAGGVATGLYDLTKSSILGK